MNVIRRYLVSSSGVIQRPRKNSASPFPASVSPLSHRQSLPTHFHSILSCSIPSYLSITPSMGLAQFCFHFRIFRGFEPAKTSKFTISFINPSILIKSNPALRVLRAHGLPPATLHEVARATTLARLLYASPAWWGFAKQQHRNTL